jgi:hypothetical protein
MHYHLATQQKSIFLSLGTSDYDALSAVSSDRNMMDATLTQPCMAMTTRGTVIVS